MVMRVEADNRVLTWARKRINLTLERAAALLKCKPGVLQKIEDGEVSPSATLFRRMSDLYLLPEATLLGLATPAERPLPRDFRSFDGAAVSLSYETVMAIRRAEARQEALAYLSEIDSSIVAPNLPIHSLKENPEKLGAGFRHQLGFPIVDQLRLRSEQAFVRWRALIEDLGVSVFVEPLGDDDSRGVSLFFNDFPAIIVDQNEKLAGARSFTLLHEFGHILVRQGGISNFNPRNVVERFCNQFAAAFLLPVEAVQAAFPKGVLHSGDDPTIPILSAAANKLCITISQLALRLEELGFANKGYYQRVARVLKPPTPKARGKGGPEYKYLYVSRYGHHLPDAVLGSLDRGAITTMEASRMLEVAPHHFAPIRQLVKDRQAGVISEYLQ
jgi:Zn-dependent peptidase ImmA (M78 family)